MTKLVALLSALLEMFRQWRRGRKAEKRQDARNALHDDPAGYMRDKYGVHDDDASKAPEADSDDHRA